MQETAVVVEKMAETNFAVRAMKEGKEYILGNVESVIVSWLDFQGNEQHAQFPAECEDDGQN